MDYGGGYSNNYSTTSYGAQGGAGGGGFMNSGSQQSPSSGRKDHSKDNLRPVTIKQLNDAQQPHADAEFRIDGQEVTQVTFVGQVRNISVQSINTTYRLDDGTGTIEVKLWTDSDADANEDAKPSPYGKVTENTYARVWGRLKSFGNKRHVGAHVIRPVQDYNEVQYHLLEATVVHLHFTKGPPPDPNSKPSGGLGQGNSSYGGGTSGLEANLQGLQLTTAARKVYEVLRTSPQSNEGMHMQEIAVKLKMAVGDVQNAGGELESNGLIYATVDESTWALLEQ